MVWIHVGDVYVHFKVVTDHESLHIFVHDPTESQEDLGMILGFVEFLKAGFMTKKAG